MRPAEAHHIPGPMVNAVVAQQGLVIQAPRLRRGSEDFARAQPFKEGFPEQYTAWKNKGGRPPAESPKVHIGFRLAADVVEGVRATGKGYNARVETVLREALASGRL